MSKLNIDFVLLDESVVMYGFRALMNGAQIEDFKRNPVMLFMHSRALSDALNTNSVLPIGKWDEVRVQDNKLMAKPIFDDDDEFAMRIEKKVRAGILNAVSIWLNPIAVSDDPQLMLPGQTGPTITKWGLFEASIVDVPNCKNALAIRNEKGETLRLFGNKDARVLDYLNTMLPGEGKAVNLRVLELVDTAIRDGRLTYGEREAYIQLAAKDYKTVSDILSRIQPLINDNLGQSMEVQELLKLTGHELYMEDKLERLKVLSYPHFLLKYKEFSGKDFPGTTTPNLQLASRDLNQEEKMELLKLSSRELYMQDKFERLKELSLPDFKLRYKEYWGSEYVGA